MGKVAVEDRRRALEVARADLEALDGEEARLQSALEAVSAKRVTLTGFISMQEANLSAESTDDVLEALRDATRSQKLSIRDAVVFLAERLPGRTITNQYAKTMIVDGLGLGTVGAVNTCLSRSTVFEKAGRGTYRLVPDEARPDATPLQQPLRSVVPGKAENR